MSTFMMGVLEAYSAGGAFLPEGDYCIKDITVLMFQRESKAGAKVGEPTLGANITFYDLHTKEEKIQFYGFGNKAALSWAPNPETAKGLVGIPGGAGQALNNNTKWGLFLKSLYDCGLPQGVFTDDVSSLEGTHVHIQNVPEPEGWSKLGNSTGEATQERKAGTVSIVTEIKDDGKPWEGTGGVPEEAPAKPAVKGKATVAAKPVAKAKPAPVEEAAEEPGDADALAMSEAAELLAKKPNGCPKIMLRTHIFSKLKTAYDDKVANTVVAPMFKNDASLKAFLEPMGYTVVGPDIKPAE